MAGGDQTPHDAVLPSVEFLSTGDELVGAEEEVVTPAHRSSTRTRRAAAALAVLAVLAAGGWRLATDWPAHHAGHRAAAQSVPRPPRHPSPVAATRTVLAPTQYLPVLPMSAAGRARAVCLTNVEAGIGVLTRSYAGAKSDGLGEQRSRRIAEATLADSLPGGSSQPWFGSVVSIWLADLSPRFDGTRPVEAYCAG